MGAPFVGFDLVSNTLGLLGAFAEQEAGSVADEVNTVTQGVASIISFTSLFVSQEAVAPNLALNVATAFAGTAALSTGIAVFDEHRSQSQSLDSLKSDATVAFGDILEAIGGFIGVFSLSVPSTYPGLDLFSKSIKLLGDVATLSGIYYHGKSISQRPDFIQNAYAATVKLAKIVNSIPGAAVNFDSNISSDWSSVQGNIDNAMNSIATLINNNDESLLSQQAQAVATTGFALSDSISKLYSDIVSGDVFKSISASQQGQADVVFVQQYQKSGYYLEQMGDSFSSVANQLSYDGLQNGSTSADTLTRINAVFGQASVTPGQFAHVPAGAAVNLLSTSNASLVGLPALQNNLSYILDPTSADVYVVGASLDGHDAGALIIDTPSFGGFAEFAAGTYSGVGLEANGNVDVALTTAAGDPLGTLSFNPSTDAGSFKLSDGFTLPTSGGAAFSITDPPETPEQVLLGYLSQLGDSLSESQLDQLDFEALHPASTRSIMNVSGDTEDGLYADDFSRDWIGATGKTNEVDLPFQNDDLSTSTFSNIQILSLNDTTINNDEFDNIPDLKINGAQVVEVADGGIYNFTDANLDLSENRQYSQPLTVVAESLAGTTIIGDSYANRTLIASALGNDTLIAGDGTGTVLKAGDGDDLLTGGSGGDTFVLGSGVDTVQGGPGNDTFTLNAAPSVGTSISGGGGTDTLDANSDSIEGIDLTGVAISGVQTLVGDALLTVAQFGEFRTISGSVEISDTAADIQNGLAGLIAGASDISGVDATDTPVEMSVATFMTAGPLLSKISGGVAIVDTAANIASGIDAITAKFPYVDSVEPTDTALSLSVSQSTSLDSASRWIVLDKVSGGFVVADTAANIISNLASLAVLMDGVNPGTFTSLISTNGTVSVSASAAEGYQSLLDLIAGGYSVAGDGSGDGFYIDGSNGPETIDGGGGINFVNTTTAATDGTVLVDLKDGIVAGGDMRDANITDIQGVQLGADPSVVLGLTSGTDLLYGGSGVDQFYNEGATDYIQGSTGSNAIVGGSGTTIFYGDGGTDVMDGGTGQNFMQAGPTAGSSDTFYGSGGTDFVYGGAGTTTVYGGSGTEDLTGGSGYSELIGSNQSAAATNILNGGSGTDVFYAGIGTNLLYEAAGTDVLAGNAGTDYVYGGAGRSFVYGTTGTDVVTTGAGNQYVKAGTGNTFFNDTAANLTANRFDQIDNFAGGGTTNMYLPSTVQGSTSFVAQNGGVAILTAIGSGSAELFVSGASVAAVQGSTHFTI